MVKFGLKQRKIEQNCSIFPSLLKGLKCQHRRELQILWQIKGFSPESLLNDLLSITKGIRRSKLDSNSEN